MNDNSDILDYLAINSDHYKDLLKDDIYHLKLCLEDQDLKLFWDDIREQFEKNARYEIAKDLSIKFPITFLDAGILLEEADMKEYLK